LARSLNLVRGRWWPTFGTILTAWLIVVILSSIASRILEAFLAGGDNLAAGLVISAAISAVTTPFIVTVLAVLYFDLRARHERFDLAGLAGEIGVSPPSPDWSSPRDERSDWPPLPPDTDGIEPTSE
jgi:hypothetical protein